MTVLRFPSPPDSKEFEAAKRVVAVFDAPAALKVASGIVLLASMKLAEKLPGLLALSFYEATQKLTSASTLASLYLDAGLSLPRRTRGVRPPRDAAQEASMNRRDRRASRRADPDAVHLAVIRAAGPMVREQVQSAEAQGVDRSELVALVVDPASPIAPYFTKLPGPPLLAPDGSRVLLMLRSTAISPASMFSPEAQKRLIDPPDEGHVHCVHLARNQGYWTMLTWDEVPSSGWMH